MTRHDGPLLVVDDHEMNRDMLSRRLRRQGYRVVTADNGNKHSSAWKLTVVRSFCSTSRCQA